MPTVGERASDWLATKVRSWPFLIGYNLFIAGWMSLNLTIGAHAPDPYPFILLNLGLSWLAGVQAPIIMMSQFRSEQVAKAVEDAFREKWEEDRTERQKDRKYTHDLLVSIHYLVKHYHQNSGSNTETENSPNNCSAPPNQRELPL